MGEFAKVYVKINGKRIFWINTFVMKNRKKWHHAAKLNFKRLIRDTTFNFI